MQGNIGDHATHFPHSVGVDITAAKALEMMKKHECHHLPVLDGGNLVGVISIRDLQISKAFPKGLETPVEHFMTEDPLIVDPDQELSEALKLMIDNRVGSLIVRTKHGQPWAIFTTTDALKLLLDQIMH